MELPVTVTSSCAVQTSPAAYRNKHAQTLNNYITFTDKRLFMQCTYIHIINHLGYLYMKSTNPDTPGKEESVLISEVS